MRHALRSMPLVTEALDPRGAPFAPPTPAAGCDLCEAARITPWFHEDELCWIAECEICAVPKGEKDDRCDLCEAAKITHWFHEDDVCWIAECEICDTPMVVWRWHGVDLAGEQQTKTRTALEYFSKLASTPA